MTSDSSRTLRGDARPDVRLDGPAEPTQQAEYWRLYADTRGETHFEAIGVALRPTSYSPPAAPLNVVQLFPATGCHLVGAPPGWSGDRPHPSPARQLFCTLRGEYAVEASDGTTRRFPPGSLLLLDDAGSVGHATRIIGPDGVLLVAVTLAG